MDFDKLQGKVETRIAALTGMHPVVVALSEGLQGSSLNAGNFAPQCATSATRRCARCGATSRAARDDRHRRRQRQGCGTTRATSRSSREDVKDQAEITEKERGDDRPADPRRLHVPDSAIAAVITGDMSLLVHTGLVSVQLQQPGADASAAAKSSFPTVATSALAPIGLPPGVTTMRAIREFWPVEGRLAALGRIPAGAEVPVAHPIVTAFPEMFAPVATPVLPAIAGRSGPGAIITRETVLAKQAELKAAGLPSGHNSLARALNVSVDTVKRRLAGN
jgi:hypothetical protein